MTEKIVRIGGASGFWGDTETGPAQLVRHGEIDYMVFDYLAEVTMSILARAYARKPETGYAIDFVTRVMRPLIADIAAKKIKVVANAGGVNPRACCDAIAKIAADAGLDLKIAAVIGDNLLDRADDLRAGGVAEISAGTPLPDGIMSINAYLGALPIAAALDRGADIVVTGRCVDSAVTLGPLIHEFGWTAEDYDRLSAGTLAGHIIECGAQATGGNFTDWEDVPGWENAGFPIAECRADGSFVLTKPPGTGGLVSPATVGEQMLYELGDPAAYIVPDAICDFSRVTMTPDGPNRVLVAGARGRAPTPTYKVSATYRDGFRSTALISVVGIDAPRKAERMAEAILAKTREMFRQRNFADYRRTDIQLLGAEHLYGGNARPEARDVREVILRIAVHHDERDALEIFSYEVTGAGLCMAPGRAGMGGGRPKSSPLVRLYSFLIDKGDVPVTAILGDESWEIEIPAGAAAGPAPRSASDDGWSMPAGETATVPLVALAWGRSGDKGDDSNIGVIARQPDYLPLLRATLTESRIAEYFRHVFESEPGANSVERFDVPGIHALNFLLHDSLGGGGVASLRTDTQGKTYAQQLLGMPVEVPAAWVAAMEQGT